MKIRKSLSVCVCIAALATGSLAAPANAAELSSSQETTTMSKEKARLAMTFGETSLEEAQKCSTSMGRGPGITLKDVSLVTCSPEEITAEDVREAWAGSSQYPALVPNALLERLMNLVLSVWELLGNGFGRFAQSVISYS